MKSMRTHVRPTVFFAIVTLALFTFAVSSFDAQQKPKEQKLNKEQQQDANILAKTVDGEMAGTGTASPLKTAWRPDYLKALDKKTYIPYTLTLDPSLHNTQLAVYLRVVDPKAPAPKAPELTAEERFKQASGEQVTPKPVAAPTYAFQDVYFVQPKAAASGGPVRLARAFAVPAGEYDVYIAYKERGKGTKSGVFKEKITVPDFWTEQLATSSVIVAERVEPVKEAPKPDEIAERPYVLGTTEIFPSMETAFPKTGELSIMFLIYNPGLSPDKKPDITVEYGFHVKTGEAEKFFNKTSPQKFDATTLPAVFDLSAGHQLVAGQSVPLGSFPVGDYRLEIKVTDNVSKQSLTRNLSFSVKES